jgi:hypothetical protein
MPGENPVRRTLYAVPGITNLVTLIYLPPGTPVTVYTNNSITCTGLRCLQFDLDPGLLDDFHPLREVFADKLAQFFGGAGLNLGAK